MTDILNDLQKNDDLVGHLLNNLAAYCDKVKQAVNENPALGQEDRQKLFLVSSKHSHHDEINDRLSFLKYYASMCDF